MSWKLVFGLSVFGLAMGIATVFVIPTYREPYFWLGVFVVSAALIAKRASGKFFLHGLATGLVNGVWVTIAHVGLFDVYVVGHVREVMMTAQYGAPRLVMAATGPVFGLASGIVLGILAWVFSKFLMPSHGDYAGW